MAAFNRDEALRNADKALKANKFDAAVAEYVRVLEHQPRDFTTANLLGDVYARLGQTDNAVGQYARIAEIFLADGFLPKASALYKKILKIRPEDEHSLLRLGQIAATQGLMADARTFFTSVSEKRRARGDQDGADAALIELADLDPSDQDARMQAARILARRGDGGPASSRLRELALDLLEKERADEAVDVLREAVHLVPTDRLTRKQLIGLLTDLGQADEAEIYLTRDAAAGDPAMLFALARAEFETGRVDEGREDLRAALADGTMAEHALTFMRQIAARKADVAHAIAEGVADAALARRDTGQAVAAMCGLLERVPSDVAGALRLVELCLEEGLDDTLPQARRMLTDAYKATGQDEAARRMEEDLGGGDPFAAPAKVDEDAIPDFDVYVYGQPSPPLDAARTSDAAESEEQLIARLLAEEAARDATPVAEVLPEIDLTASLDSLDEPAAAGASAPPLEDVFEGFRERNRVEGLERAESAFEEASLAAALGQMTDAERLYAEASRAIPYRFRAAAALGRVLLQQGRLAEAIEWMERATEAPAPDRDTGHALMYDLGDALERHGESMRALAIFMELNADAGDYRGIAARVERLARAEIGG